MLPINYFAVFVAAVANFVIGFLFHGPLFGKTWMRLANIHPTGNEKLSNMVPQMVKNFIANLVFAYVLACFCLLVFTSSYLNAGGAINGIRTAIWVWIGFIVTSSSMDVIWMGRSYKLWLFESVASLVSILTMGAIIGAWK